jgi:hypothetical protein
MKKYLLVLLLTSSALLTKAQDSGFGLGIMIGAPTGISAKAWVGGDRAIGMGLAWGTRHSGYLHLHADYLFHNMDLIQVGSGQLPLYYGPGLRLRSWGNDGYWHRGRFYEDGGSHVDLGVRFPVGLAYLFEGAPVDIFLEVVPTLDLVPSTSFEVDGGLGARYWF